MSDDLRMKQLGETARAERTDVPGEPELATPLSDGELDAILGRAATALASADVAPKRRGSVTYLRILAPLAAAAAVALFFARGAFTPGAVPAYDLDVEGSSQSTRSGGASAPDVIHVARDGRLTLLLRPRTPGSRSVGVEVMVEHDGTLRAWNVPSRVSNEGAVRIDATGGALAELPDGASRVVLFVGPPEQVPHDPASAERALDGTAGVQVLSRPIAVP